MCRTIAPDSNSVSSPSSSAGTWPNGCRRAIGALLLVLGADQAHLVRQRPPPRAPSGRAGRAPGPARRAAPSGMRSPGSSSSPVLAWAMRDRATADVKLALGHTTRSRRAMAALKSRIDTRSEEFKAQRRVTAAPGRRPARARRRGRARRRRQVARAPRRARQAAAARARRRPARRRRAVPRDRPARRHGHVRRRGARRRNDRRHRPRPRPGMHDRRQRRDGEGRHLLPDDGEEAPARAGDRAAEPPAVPLPGRLRRRVPAAPGRGLPRPRALRPDLLQPGQHERAGDRPDRRRHGLVHGGRRLRAGDERRDDHRQEPGHDLPRRAAAGEGGDRRGRQRRGARRRRRAHAPLRRRRPSRRRRSPRAGDRAPDRRQPQSHASPRR